MVRRPSASVAVRNRAILVRIQAIKSDHPFWGYRRIWAHLRFVDTLDVNKKRIYRLMQMHRLLATQTTHGVPRTSLRPKPRAERPNQWWGIDMTKVMTETGWCYLVIVLDWYTKQIVGHHCGKIAASREWLSALERGVDRQFPHGVKDRNLHLMSDNGSQPTSVKFMTACGYLGIVQAFTSYNNPKGNADDRREWWNHTERMMRTIKEELLWLREWQSPFEVTAAMTDWIERYNETYLHSALKYRTPNQAEVTYNLGHETLFKSA